MNNSVSDPIPEDIREQLIRLRDTLFPIIEPYEKRNPPMRGDDYRVDQRDDERYAVEEFIDELLKNHTEILTKPEH